MTTATRHPVDLPKIELKRKATKDVPLYVIDSVQEVYDQARRYAANLLPVDDLGNTYDEDGVDDTEHEVRLELTKAHDTIVVTSKLSTNPRPKTTPAPSTTSSKWSTSYVTLSTPSTKPPFEKESP